MYSNLTTIGSLFFSVDYSEIQVVFHRMLSFPDRQLISIKEFSPVAIDLRSQTEIGPP